MPYFSEKTPRILKRMRTFVDDFTNNLFEIKMEQTIKGQGSESHPSSLEDGRVVTDFDKVRFCQSCGMPLTENVLGTNADGSKSEEYCIYCYQDSKFTTECTMEEMAGFCSQFVDEYNKHTGQNLSREEYKQMLLQFYPNLKRWKKQ